MLKENKQVMKPAKITTIDMTAIALVTAITCILGPMAIPIVISPVPISFTNLVLYLSLYLLKTKKTLVSYLVYLLLGTAGLPVFSGFSGGLTKLAGPTGGYLIGFIFMVLIAGVIMEKAPKNRWIHVVGMVLGTAVCYAFGTVWLCYQLHISFGAGLGMGVLPYLPGDGAKILLAVLAGPVIAKRVRTAAN